MKLTRWEPFEAMDLVFNRFSGFFRFGRPQLGTGEYLDWSPATDISETDKEYLIRAALPAVKKEDVRVTWENGVLTLSGERRQQEEQKDEKFHRVESYYGNFSRTFALPDVIDEDAIKAESKDGVLTIHVPKAQSEVTKLTAIKAQ
jgi:HSP20 family protein